jgi:hypothetical protein
MASIAIEPLKPRLEAQRAGRRLPILLWEALYLVATLVPNLRAAAAKGQAADKPM